MKELIVIIGTAILGCMIFEMMVGPSDDSLRNVAARELLKAKQTYIAEVEK